MDLNARFDEHLATVDINFQMVTVTYFRDIFFHFHTNQHKGPIFTPYKISAKYTKSFRRNRLKCQARYKFFSVDVTFQTVIVTYFRYRFFFILILFNIEVPLIFHAKFQPKILSHSGENADFY